MVASPLHVLKFMVLIAVVARTWGFVNTTMERGGIHLVLLNLQAWG